MRRKKKESEKSLKSFFISHILCTFAPDKEPFLRPFGSKRRRRWLWYANHGRM